MVTNSKKPGQSVDGAGSVLSTVSGPSDAAPPQSLGRHDERADTLLEKVVAGQDLAAGTAFNANKPDEYGDDARTPEPGATVAPSAPVATASSATETVASAKVGDGVPPHGENRNNGPLDRVRVDSSAQPLTTNQGVPVADNQSSLKLGLRGPTLMEDFILREKITHFDHERIPERVVHARGSAAHGYFESYQDLGELTRAAPFAHAGKRTPVFVRFSTVAGERGSADTVRDVRGFAVKFYTDEGNWDLVGNNMPVFFIQDAMKFPDLVHSVKPEPHHAMPQASSAHDTFWDFVSLMPESAHMLMWLMSDRAIPRSYRTMQGFGVHTFRLVNREGASVFCKFHWNPLGGTHSLVWDEAAQIIGADPDYHRRDLWEAIEAGNFPEWELGLQIFTEEQAEQFGFDVLDATKIVPEELVPLRIVGKLVLDRNPDNFFAETEQVAFCTAHIVPGIDFTHDPLLQGRIHSYVDTQISRLGGPNFHEIPINAPLAQVHNNQRDGMHRQSINRGRVNYEPNSLGGGCPFQAGMANGFTSFPQPLAEDKVRGKPELFGEHYGQARLFWTSQSAAERQHIINAYRFELTRVQTPAVRLRVLALLANVDATLAGAVAQGLGLALPAPLPLASDVPPPPYQPSPPLSLLHRPGQSGVATRRVAILVGPGEDGDAVRKLYADLLKERAVPRLVASHMGELAVAKGAPLDVEISLEAGPSVLYDAVLLPGAEAAAQQLGRDAHALDFLRLQYRHCKPLLVLGAGAALLAKAGVPTTLPDGSPDPALIVADPADAAAALLKFKAALAAHRSFARETDPPRV
ncbi:MULTISPECIES: catalase [unclassified Janthinobacterium]|uniref:catalase n=1 Tax=unclassified Janthinobacterium TaxID=2610881 RepID=UPI000349FD29|nr:MULTISPECIES: catalase [unclassified Janthinobacterium]MEC5159849.1 catalase [Janthinobacterium sp. CG_S6]